jgi:hypothetical protein
MEDEMKTTKQIGPRTVSVEVSAHMPAWAEIKINNSTTDKTLIRSIYSPRAGTRDGNPTITDGESITILIPQEVVDFIVAEFGRQRLEIENRDGARRNRIQAIPGLAELRKALADEERYEQAFREMMEDEQNDGVHPPRAPMVDAATLANQYPAAWALIQCEHMQRAANYAKAGAGRRAIERIGDGADPVQALAQAEAEWGKAASEMID